MANKSMAISEQSTYLIVISVLLHSCVRMTSESKGDVKAVTSGSPLFSKPVPASKATSWYEPDLSYNLLDTKFWEGDVSNWKCPICLSVCTDPVEPSCGHLHCETCLRKHLEVQARQYTGGSCSLCRKPVAMVDVIRSSNLRRTMDQHRLICPACNVWKGDRNTLTQRHFPECTEVPLRCKRCNVTFSRRDMDKHRKTDCKQREQTCRLCKQDIVYTQMEAHLRNECPQAPVDCPNGCCYAPASWLPPSILTIAATPDEASSTSSTSRDVEMAVDSHADIDDLYDNDPPAVSLQASTPQHAVGFGSSCSMSSVSGPTLPASPLPPSSSAPPSPSPKLPPAADKVMLVRCQLPTHHQVCPLATVTCFCGASFKRRDGEAHLANTRLVGIHFEVLCRRIGALESQLQTERKQMHDLRNQLHPHPGHFVVTPRLWNSSQLRVGDVIDALATDRKYYLSLVTAVYRPGTTSGSGDGTSVRVRHLGYPEWKEATLPLTHVAAAFTNSFQHALDRIPARFESTDFDPLRAWIVCEDAPVGGGYILSRTNLHIEGGWSCCFKSERESPSCAFVSTPSFSLTGTSTSLPSTLLSPFASPHGPASALPLAALALLRSGQGII